MTAIIKREISSLRWSQWLAIFGLVVLFVALRWNNCAAPLTRDEGEYAYSAQLLIQGLAPYQHAFVQKPPAVIYSYAFADLILPNIFWSPRLLAAVFIAGATILLGFIARLELGEGFALPAMWLATPMFLLPGIELFDANVEPFLLLPLIGTVAVYCYSRQHGNKNIHWMGAGFLAAATLLYKYTALPILAFLFTAWLFEMWRQGTKATFILQALACALAGGILATALELAYFLFHDGGKTFWECTVAFNRYYAGTGAFGFNFFWSRVKDLFANWWILFLIPWAILLQPHARAWFWLGIFGCALVATNTSSYGHYYLVVMPFWALLALWGIRALSSRAGEERSQRIAGLITIAVVVLLVCPDLRLMRCSPQQFAEEKIGGYPFIEAQLVADEVSRMSSPNDFIYVAGSEPEILCYARRFAPTRFITAYALMIPTPLTSGYQAEAIRDLRQNPPRLIVFAQSGAGWLRQASTPPEFQNFLGGFLKQNYVLEGAYVKPAPPNGYWSTNLNRDEFKAASLLLYVRKTGV
jgi:hypothetical protein